MQRHESETRPERRVVPYRDGDRTPPGNGADDFAVADAQALAVFRSDVERLAPAKRRGVSGGLDSGVVGVEPPPRREPDREVLGKLVDRRVVLDDMERR